METAFYIVGTALVLIALAISFIGMRSDGFPSPKGLRIGLAFVAIVVLATTVLAVRASKHEAAEREHAENVEASVNEEQQTLTNEDAGTGTTTTEAGGGNAGTGGGGTGDAAAGAQVFSDQGCGGCHTLKAADATGQIGPDLDTALVGKDAKFIETSIVDPSAEIAKGYEDGTMPADFGDKIPPDQLSDLVAFLQQSTSQGSEGSN